MATVGPIHANEINQIREALIPAAVFQTFNKLIADGFSGTQAIVHQDAVIKLLVEQGFSSQEIYDNHWLDIEDSYRKVGWKVKYDKPDYTENYASFFVFEKK